jgi:hypothetical protein
LTLLFFLLKAKCFFAGCHFIPVYNINHNEGDKKSFFSWEPKYSFLIGRNFPFLFGIWMMIFLGEHFIFSTWLNFLLLSILFHNCHVHHFNQHVINEHITDKHSVCGETKKTWHLTHKQLGFIYLDGVVYYFKNSNKYTNVGENELQKVLNLFRLISSR